MWKLDLDLGFACRIFDYREAFLAVHGLHPMIKMLLAHDGAVRVLRAVFL